MTEVSNPPDIQKKIKPQFGVDTIDSLKKPSKAELERRERSQGAHYIPEPIIPTEPAALDLQIQDIVDQNGILIPKPDPEPQAPIKNGLKLGDIMPIRPGWVMLSGVYGEDSTHEIGINTQRRTDLVLDNIIRPESGVAPTFVLRDKEGKRYYFSKSGKTWRGKKST